MPGPTRTTCRQRVRSDAGPKRSSFARSTWSEASTTLAAVCRYVDLLKDEGNLPEAVVIAFKATVAESESLQRFESEVREALRSALVSACIERYFSRRVADDVRIAKGRTLRL